MDTKVRALATAALAIVLAASLFPGVPSGAGAATGDPFFSEYVEGPSGTFAKAIEIYNPGPAPIDLAASFFAVEVIRDGVNGFASIPLTGTVAAGDVFVLAHPSSVAAVLAQADQLDVRFDINGNDGVVLRRNTTYLDVIGQAFVDPGAAGWGQPPTSTTDSVLRRKPSVTSGDTNGDDTFDPASEWDGLANTDFSGLGVHAIDGPSSGGTVDADVTMAASAACLELSETSISFGTLGFGAEDQPASPSVTLTNCATASETLLASATDAVGLIAGWTLVDSSATCADTLGIDNYRLDLHSPELAAPVSLANLGKSVGNLTAGAATVHTAHIFTPCPGSSGDGETLTFQINYLATE